jgi:hypothetical protein
MAARRPAITNFFSLSTTFVPNILSAKSEKNLRAGFFARAAAIRAENTLAGPFHLPCQMA